MPRFPSMSQHRTLFWSASPLSKLETAAKADVDNVPSQLALYQAYLKKSATDKTALSDLVKRYEQDTSLFASEPNAARSLPLLSNPEAWELYLKALVQIEQEAPIAERIQAATQARAAIVSTPPVVDSGTAAAETTSATPTLSNEQLATAVLSRNGTQTVKLKDGTPSYAGAGAASAQATPTASSASAAKAEPIRVIVEEARGSLIFRGVRWLLGIAIYAFLVRHHRNFPLFTTQ